MEGSRATNRATACFGEFRGGILKIPRSIQKKILQRTAKYRTEQEKFLLFMRKSPSRSISERKLLISVYFNNNPKKIRAAIIKTAALMEIQGEQKTDIVEIIARLYVFSERQILRLLKKAAHF